MNDAHHPRDVVERLLRAAIGPRPQEMADCYAQEVIIEMPFTAAGLYPARTQTTREELRARFAAGGAVRRYTGLGRTVIHETADPDVIIVEYELDGHLVTTGEPFTLPFVMVLTIHDGHITHSRDYTDPIAGARAMGRVPQLLTALAATTD